MFTKIRNGLRFQYDFETLEITACGKNGFRVRSTYGHNLPKKNWSIKEIQSSCKIEIKNDVATLVNGSTSIQIEKNGYMSFFKDNKLIFRDYNRNFDNFNDSHTRSPLRLKGREYALYPSKNFKATVTFEAPDKNEKIYGMGQYQHSELNLKGMCLELVQKNTQSSVPVFMSSNKYIFFWNNPSTGRATFAKDRTIWEAENTSYIDYWFSTGESFKELMTNYCEITGFSGEMPDYALGFWQSKLRYQTQDEIYEVAKEYKKRNLPLSVIVEDFFHWKYQGDWGFDKKFFPNPAKLTKDLDDLGVKLMVSIWPTVEPWSKNYSTLLEKGCLMNTRYGKRVGLDFLADTTHIDVTNPVARKEMWKSVNKNYSKKGIELFWLDEAEPEMNIYQMDNYVFDMGLANEVGNSYAYWYAKTFDDGLKAGGKDKSILLLRCAWAGSQKYNVLLWSGDINCTFEGMRNQLQCGLNVGMAGIPWWTCDIGGFHGGNIHDEKFIELLTRWFAWGAFMPVFRLHGDRQPAIPPVKGAIQQSGSPNEIWSFGEKTYEILKNYLFMREKIRPYLSTVMKESSTKGYPMMRTMFFEFDDPKCFEFEDQYMLGSDLLVAPIFEANPRERKVYLPAGTQWVDIWSKKVFQGGQVVDATIDIDKIPLFAKLNSQVEKELK